MRYTDPTGHSIPIQCFICDVEFADISEWSHPAIALAEVGCLVVGCHVDRTQGVIRGPTREEWVAGQAAGFMPAGVVAKPAAVAGGRIAQQGALRYLSHTSPEAFQSLLRLGARDSATIRTTIQSAGSDSVIRGITDTAGNQILLRAGNRNRGLWHILGRHLTGDLPGTGTTFFSNQLNVGDVVDLVAQTVQNGTRTFAETEGTWIYQWSHRTHGDVKVIVSQSGDVISAFPTR